MKTRHASRTWLLSLLAAAAPVPATADGLAAEVYRDAAITIRAGLEQRSSQVVHFGDVLVMRFAVEYDPARVAVRDPEPAFFTSAWPAAHAVQLTDWQLHEDAGGDTGRELLRATFRFQILGCPDDAAPTCPGDRTYALPEFELGYRRVGEAADAARPIRFRPWPDTVTVSTTMQHDEEGQLLAFESYFPTGGYPDPLTGADGGRAAVLTAGVALAVMTGGLLMWPFNRRSREKSTTDLPRWRRQLDTLRAMDAADDARYLDGLRRCLVWYCNDELALDPFVWLDLAEHGDEPGAESADDRRHAELRTLFVELLHNPAGQGVELRTRLESLLGQAGRA